MVSLGEVDLNNMNAEIGFWMGKDYRKMGYMQNAIKIILNFGFKELKLERIYAKVFSINEGSINLLKKMGFKYEGTLRKSFLKDGVFMDDLFYSVLKEEHNNTK